MLRKSLGTTIALSPSFVAYHGTFNLMWSKLQINCCDKFLFLLLPSLSSLLWSKRKMSVSKWRLAYFSQMHVQMYNTYQLHWGVVQRITAPSKFMCGPFVLKYKGNPLRNKEQRFRYLWKFMLKWKYLWVGKNKLRSTPAKNHQK